MNRERLFKNGLVSAVQRGRSPAQASMNLEFTQLSDRGQVRRQNEDYVGYAVPQTPRQAKTHGWLFALADGVGGQAQGEVASRTAVETVLAGFREAAKDEPLAALLMRLVEEANHSVQETALAAGPNGAGMATTLVACALRAGRAAVAHVGDSRCYLIRRGRAIRLTRDHTIASEQARMGILSSQEEAEAHTRHVLSRSLGTGPSAQAEFSEHIVVAGDVLVLCSDGLHGEVSGAEIAAAVRENRDLHAAARKLLALANQRGGRDNISVQMIRVVSAERVGTYRGLPYRLR